MDTSKKNKWDIYQENCPTRLLLDRIADKWTVLIIGQLHKKTFRFNELRRIIPGITQKMLTQTLRGLEKDGLITRKIYATVPLKVEYSLTALGYSLTEVLNNLANWAEANMENIIKAQKFYGKMKNRNDS
jgi:DNA-binding HxlR family transcriptional regulator